MHNQIKSICKFFRIENSHSPGKSVSKYWQEEDESSKQYFCIHTMKSIGPDSGLVSPENCYENRKCFELKDRISL
jgi:hypothetical protein